jgi:hypothetical protein
MHRRALLIGLVVVATTACGIDLWSPAPEPGSREWLIRVDNQSRQEARLVIAETHPGTGQTTGVTVGRVEPSIVPAMTSMDVTFTVPPGDGWAIFVNPEQGHGPVIQAVEVPRDAVGELPISIGVFQDATPGMLIPADFDMDWFGW